VDSTNKNLEWRLSFSVVEKEIIKEIPQISKRAFMICKELMAFKIFQKLYGLTSTNEWKNLFIRESEKSEEIGLVPMGLHPMGMQPMGMHPMGMHPMGLYPSFGRNDGMKSAGVSIVEKISKKIKDDYGPLTTYHWKTALLNKMDESREWTGLGPTDLYNTVRELIESVLKAVKEKSMSNYFLPDMNLYYKFTKEDEQGQFERSQKLLEEILDDFPNTIKSLVFSKNYNVNFEGECERHHLFSYGEFESFRREITNIPNVLLLEGYFTFLSSLFNINGLNQPSESLVNKIRFSDNRPYISIKHSYFLTRMTSCDGGLPDQNEVDFHNGYNTLIRDILKKFPLLILTLVKEVRLDRDLFSKLFENDPQITSISFLYAMMSTLPTISMIGTMLALSTQDKLKTSVAKYINTDDGGEINIDQLESDIRANISEKANAHEILCNKIVNKIVNKLKEYDFEGQEPMVVEWLTEEKMRVFFRSNGVDPILSPTFYQVPLLSDLLATPVDVFMKLLRAVCEAENREWKKVDATKRSELLKILQ